MRVLSLETIEISGFKSYKQPVTIALTTDPGLKFITGRNLHTPRLGANGAGKSSIWDAVAWCWYGASLRGAKAAVLRARGAERADVATRLLIGATAHLVRRVSHPEKITIDDQPASQADVDSLLGLSRLRFMQSVIFGQAVPLFYDLSVPARGDLLDELLEGDLWTDAADLASKEARRLEEDGEEIRRTLSNYKGRLQTVNEELNTAKRMASEWADECDRRILKLADSIDTHEAAIKRLQSKYDQLAEGASIQPDPREVDALRRDVGSMQNVLGAHQSRIAEIGRLIGFYEHHTDCPECKQRISSDFRDEQIRALRRARELTDKQIAATRKEIATRERLIAQERENESKRSHLRWEMQDVQQKIADAHQAISDSEKLGKELLESRDNNNMHLRQIGDLKDKYDKLHREMRAEVARLSKVEASMHRMQYWKSGFKRVRVFRMKRVLAHLELETANAANALGLIDWRIRFVAETDSKRPGVYIQIERNNAEEQGEWSPGELQRVRLAVALGLAHMIQQMSGVLYNWEVFDEPTSWLSKDGIDDLIEQLQYRAHAERRSIWLIDHRVLDAEFDERWLATKDREGSTVERIT